MANTSAFEFASREARAGAYDRMAAARRRNVDTASPLTSGLAQTSVISSSLPINGQLDPSSAESRGLIDPVQPRPTGGRPKRALDLVVAGVALFLAAPLMLMAALLIKIFAGGPVLFVHKRIGFNGKPFNCYKFRTMVPNAGKVLEEYLARHPEADREWRDNQKLARDPRVTFLGKMLRKASIDELPQLFNVLRGDMSCVGPRPVVAEELQRYGVFADDYLRTRPGMTGPWQVSGRDTLDYAVRVSLDSCYVRNWSFWTDVSILARTTVAVMRFEQAS